MQEAPRQEDAPTACFVMSDFAALTSMAPSGPAPETATAPATRSFAELLVTTGLCLSEASFLLAPELADLAHNAARGRQARFELPSALTKGERSRGLAAGIWEPAGLRCCAERFL